jgi:hypothetical protein
MANFYIIGFMTGWSNFNVTLTPNFSNRRLDKTLTSSKSFSSHNNI